MADKFFMQDQGDIIWHDGAPWVKDGTSTTDAANAAMQAGVDEGNLQPSPTYGAQDPQGNQQYAAVDYAIALRNYFYDGVTPPVDDWETFIASVPVDGVLRIRPLTGVGVGGEVRINGNVVATGIGYNVAEAIGINVQVGDHVEVKTGSNTNTAPFEGLIYPFVYVHPDA